MPAPLAPHGSAGIGAAPGTCGELAQGLLPGGRRFHVTCPIDLGVVVEVTLHPAAHTTIDGTAPQAWKTRRALLLAARELRLGPARMVVAARSDLPTAKGLASSTADMVAAMRALAVAAGTTLEPETIARLAATVEATDGVMFAGVAAVDQESGERLRDWDWWPAFSIAMFMPPGTRETATTTFPGQERFAEEYADLLGRLDEAVCDRDTAAFAAQATRSAELNEAFVANPILPGLLGRMEAAGALGVCVGHSGTVAGLLFAPGDAALAGEAAGALLPSAPVGTVTRVVHVPAPPASVPVAATSSAAVQPRASRQA